MEQYELEYVDDRPIVIPKPKLYRGAVSLPNAKGNTITVTANERIQFLSYKNGKKPCWIEKKTTRQNKELKEE